MTIPEPRLFTRNNINNGFLSLMRVLSILLSAMMLFVFPGCTESSPISSAAPMPSAIEPTSSPKPNETDYSSAAEHTPTGAMEPTASRPRTEAGHGHSAAERFHLGIEIKTAFHG